MFLEFTRKNDGIKILVEHTEVKILEPDSDGVSTHVVLGADLVRVIAESPEVVKNMVASAGVVSAG